jgi:hypothetical protein
MPHLYQRVDEPDELTFVTHQTTQGRRVVAQGEPVGRVQSLRASADKPGPVWWRSTGPR